MVLPGRSVVQWPHPFASGCLGEPDRVAGGDDDVSVVEQPVDGGGREGLGHQLVERGWVQVRTDRDAAFLVGCIDEPKRLIAPSSSAGPGCIVTSKVPRAVSTMSCLLHGRRALPHPDPPTMRLGGSLR